MSTKSIVFVDSRVANYKSLIDSLTEPAEVFVLDGASDGLTQMADRLYGRTGIDAIHVISHGSVGALYLGSTVLDGDNLASYQSQLAGIGSALSETGDILLYGCNVAQGVVGLQFINSLAQDTGADVAASSDATGVAVLGGDWVLEATAGLVEPATISAGDFSGLLLAGTGKITTELGGTFYGLSVTLQNDGRIVAGGYGNNAILGMVRYNVDGSLDSTFDTDGIVLTPFGVFAGIGGVTVQPDGKLLVAGNRVDVAFGPNDMVLLRYNVDGSLDHTFGSDGKSIADFGFNSIANGIALQADGKIVIAGSADGFALARFTTVGHLDTTFGNGGLVTTSAQSSLYGQAVALQSDGKIIVAGIAQTPGQMFALVRYNPDGSMDTSFGLNGTVNTDFWTNQSGYNGPDSCWSMVIQADGKIVVAGGGGDGQFSFELARYNTDGSLDTTFDFDGLVITEFEKDTIATSVTLQADGKILATGYDLGRSGQDNFILVRYNIDGSIDSNFGVNGKISTDFGGSDSGRAVTVQTNGKIVVSGFSDGKYAIARYNIDGSLDTSFGAVNSLPNGAVTISGAPTQGQTLVANNTISDLDGLGAISLQWKAAGQPISGATKGTFVPGEEHIGKTITVTAAYTDGQGTTESVTSSPTSSVVGVPFSGSGIVASNMTWHSGETITITGNVQIADGATLTIEPGVIVNGGGHTVQTYGSLKALGSTANPIEFNQVNFTFGSAVATPGRIEISHAQVSEGTFLPPTGNASYGSFSLTDSVFSDVGGFYVWYPTAVSHFERNVFLRSDGLSIGINAGIQVFVTNNLFAKQDGAAITNWASYGGVNTIVTGNSFISTDRVAVSLPDGYDSAAMLANSNYFGTTDPVVIAGMVHDRADSLAVANFISYSALSQSDSGTPSFQIPNDPPTGTVFITGVPIQGQSLSASSTLADADGIGNLAYQWKAGGTAITGATSNTLLIAEPQVGKTISVSVAYTDGNGTLEGSTSAATSVVTNVNDFPTGVVTLSGTPTQGQTLTAINTLADIDGLGAISYQWSANGTAITDATGSTLVLSQAQVGKTITATASYTDGHGTVESRTSSASAAVANLNDAPTGLVNIAGNTSSGQTLTATNTLADADGLGTLSYQWLADSIAITGATSSTLVLAAAQVGKAISVTASYTDGFGAHESVSSAATAAVSDIPPQNRTGTPNADTLTGGLGNDSLNGLEGTDTAVYTARMAAYTTSPTAISGPDGNDTLTSIERISFTDANLAFDLDGNAGQTYRLYQAAFNRTPDLGGLGGWIAGMDAGMTPEEVATKFMESGEFQSLYGANPSNEQFVSLLFTNALHRTADAEGLAYWVNQLASNLQTRAQALYNLAESPENQASVLPAITNGILYATSTQAAGPAKGQTFTGTASTDSLIGSVGNDTFNSAAGNDNINAGFGNDTITAGLGNDSIDGGGGLDLSIYSGNKASYTVLNTNGTLTVSGGTDGTDTLTHVERLKFDDTALAFDISGNAGQTYRLYQAAFNRTPDKAGLSGWINGVDAGMKMVNVAASFIASDEFTALYGAAPSASDFVTLLYKNALHRDPDQAGFDYWVGQVAGNYQSREQVLYGFSESDENQAALIGVIEGGIEYVGG
jgi:uncharacterized delta-60 repeat protein